jgi:tRNA (cytidine/uridine-2'-O-)-methyltransferase
MPQKMPFLPVSCEKWTMTSLGGMRLALYQPDIPQNAGSLMRLCACLGVGLDIIEPCGFLLSDRNLRRAGMDYLDRLDWARHASWEQWQAGRGPGRMILLTTRGAQPYTEFAFRPDDTLLVGRESAGVPDEVHNAADAGLLIPMRPGMRSLNVAQAAAMVLGEALRQTALFPRMEAAACST